MIAIKLFSEVDIAALQYQPAAQYWRKKGGAARWFFNTILVLIGAMGVLQAFAQSQTFTTAGSHSFTVPAGVTSVQLQIWGGGGAGGGSSTNGTAGGGGGGGAYRIVTLVGLIPGTVYTNKITVGGGGTATTGIGGTGGALV